MGTFRRRLLHNASLFLICHISRFQELWNSSIFSVYQIPLIMGTFRRRLLRNASLFLIFHISRFDRLSEFLRAYKTLEENSPAD